MTIQPDHLQTELKQNSDFFLVEIKSVVQVLVLEWKAAGLLYDVRCSIPHSEGSFSCKNSPNDL